MAPPLKAEQDKGALRPSGLSIIIHCGGEVAALVLIKDKLIAAGGVSENKIPEFLKGWGLEYNSLAT